MPKFKYKAMTNRGQIIERTVVETSKNACITKIKKSGMTPISVKQVVEYQMSKTKQELDQRKNLKSKEQVKQEKELISRLSKRKTQDDEIRKKLNSAVNFSLGGKKVSPRDIRIFSLI